MSHLTADRVHERLRYVAATGQFFWRKQRRGPRRLSMLAGCLRPNGYRTIAVDREVNLAHRLAWLLVYGEWPDGDLDHINGERDDNRIVNLRLATRAQNNMNARRPCSNTSGYKGASFCRGKWDARIGIDGKDVYLGSFDTPEEAHAAYANAASKVFGEFARLD